MDLTRTLTNSHGELIDTYPTVRYDPELHTYRMWYNAFVGGHKPHPSWDEQFKPPIKAWPRRMDAMMYSESKDGVIFSKPELGAVAYPWNGTHGMQLDFLVSFCCSPQHRCDISMNLLLQKLHFGKRPILFCWPTPTPIVA